jgi:predicted transposase/invertase (TIGR01784 family)
MSETQNETYAQITSDWTFKRIFASETSDKLLVFLLNTLLKRQLKAPVTSAVLIQTVELGLTPENRGAVFDLQCRDADGRHFIVEMQLGEQKDFIKRALFGLSLRFSALAEKGGRQEKAFNVPALYHLSFIDFELDFGKPCTEAVQYLSMRNDLHPEVRYELLHMAFVCLPRFNQAAEKCTNDLDKLVYTIKNAQSLSAQPKTFQGEEFDSIFELAKISKFTEKERLEYEASMKYLNAYRDSLAYAEEKGGLRHAQTMARRMLADNEPIDKIERYTGLSEPEILTAPPSP